MAYYPIREGFGESLQDVAYQRNTIANTLTWGTAPSDNTYVWPTNNQGNRGVQIPTSTLSIQTPSFYQRTSGYEPVTVMAVVNASGTPTNSVPIIGVTNGTDYAEVFCAANTSQPKAPGWSQANSTRWRWLSCTKWESTSLARELGAFPT
jgi:hypothetical protein